MNETKPSDRLAILWSFNPLYDYPEDNDLVGSVHAHMGHLERHGAVYWGLAYKVTKETLQQFDFPLSGYMYNSKSGLVEYRTRVTEIIPGPIKRHKEYVPLWRKTEAPLDHLFILMDQIDRLWPERYITDFVLAESQAPAKAPPSGGYLKVLDPLF